MQPERLPRDALVALVLEVLEKHGRMTRHELERLIDGKKGAVASVLTRMARGTPRRPKRVRIADYVREEPGVKRHLRPVYELGNEPDAKRPEPEPRGSINKRYWARRSTGVKRAASVFDWAQTFA